MYLAQTPQLDDRLFDWDFAGPTLLFMGGIFISMFLIRLVAEAIAPGLKTNYWWRENGLKAIPILLGAVFAIWTRHYPMPGAISQSLLGRIFFGMVCGLASRWLYKVIKSIIKKKFGVEVSYAPGPTDEAMKDVKIPKHDPPPSDTE